MITGIVAEFNPFHNGHQYLLNQVDGLKIVAMSGNFVQRGEPAFLDKWTRTQMALASGADLVVELPFLVAVQSADYFAQGAVDILAKLGVEQLAFGTEELLDYTAISLLYQDKVGEMSAFLASLPVHLSYPQKSQLMWEHFAGLRFTGDSPNHILALAYAKATSSYGLTLRPIERQGAGFHSLEREVSYASATSLRHHRQDEAFVRQFSPHADVILQAPQVTWDQYWPFLRYQVMTCSDLTMIYQVNDEIASRLKKAITTASSVEALVDQVATKRYTKARLRRILTYILVNARENHLPEGIRVLGFSPAGQKHLQKLKKEVQLISRIGKLAWDDLSQQADQVYRLGNPDLPEQNWGRQPIRLVK